MGILTKNEIAGFQNRLEIEKIRYSRKDPDIYFDASSAKIYTDAAFYLYNLCGLSINKGQMLPQGFTLGFYIDVAVEKIKEIISNKSSNMGIYEYINSNLNHSTYNLFGDNFDYDVTIESHQVIRPKRFAIIDEYFDSYMYLVNTEVLHTGINTSKIDTRNISAFFIKLIEIIINEIKSNPLENQFTNAINKAKEKITPFKTISITDEYFKLFSYGSGTFNKDYMIFNKYSTNDIKHKMLTLPDLETYLSKLENYPNGIIIVKNNSIEFIENENEIKVNNLLFDLTTKEKKVGIKPIVIKSKSIRSYTENADNYLHPDFLIIKNNYINSEYAYHVNILDNNKGDICAFTCNFVSFNNRIFENVIFNSNNFSLIYDYKNIINDIYNPLKDMSKLNKHLRNLNEGIKSFKDINDTKMKLDEIIHIGYENNMTYIYSLCKLNKSIIVETSTKSHKETLSKFNNSKYIYVFGKNMFDIRYICSMRYVNSRYSELVIPNGIITVQFEKFEYMKLLYKIINYKKNQNEKN